LRAEKKAYARVHEAHEKTRQEFEELKRVVVGFSSPSATLGPNMDTDRVSPTLPPSLTQPPSPTLPPTLSLLPSPTLPPSPTQPSSPTVAPKDSVLVESIDTDTPEPSVSMQERSPTCEVSNVESALPIAKRVRKASRTCQPSLLQISPYVNPLKKVYQSRKRARSHPLDEEDRANKVDSADVGEGTIVGCSLHAGVLMTSPIRTDAGIDDIAGSSEAPGTPTV